MNDNMGSPANPGKGGYRETGIQDREGGLSSESTSSDELRAAKEYAEMIVDSVREGLLILDLDLRVQAANQSFYDRFETGPEKTTGRLVYELGGGEWDISELHELLEEILPEDKVMNGFEVEHDFPEIGRRVMLLNARQVDEHDLVLLAIEDVTARRKAERQLRELTARLARAERKERHRIAQILHDDLQQQLYGAGLALRRVRERLPLEKDADKEAAGGETAREEAAGGEAGPMNLRQVLDQAEEVLDEAIETTRSLSAELSPPVLKNEGLREAVAWLRSLMQRRYGLTVELQAEGEARVTDEDLRVLLFQVVRELLFNVVKHAGVETARVEIRHAKGEPIRIRVMDEGKGFDPARAAQDKAAQDEDGGGMDGGGFGLANARERLRLIGGRLEIESAPGEGTCVTAVAPMGQIEPSGLEPSELEPSQPGE